MGQNRMQCLSSSASAWRSTRTCADEESLQTKLQTNHAAQHGMGITRRDHRSKNAEPERTLSYCAARVIMRILELENRCTGNRTVGSNPTLSATNYVIDIPYCYSFSEG